MNILQNSALITYNNNISMNKMRKSQFPKYELAPLDKEHRKAFSGYIIAIVIFGAKILRTKNVDENDTRCQFHQCPN